ncbi:MAG: DinB family protein [Acidobacteriota bacterium]
MIRSIVEFEKYWGHEREGTLKILDALTDASLSQAVSPGDRTIGRMAWHITTSIPEMMERAGLALAGPAANAPVPSTAAAIRSAYAEASGSLLDQVKAKWEDSTLQVEDDMYGERWKRGFTLLVLINHQIHHRAQMTVLMRQAGLRVPGVYGPSKEEWVNYGAEPPAV